jgi:hypothetical protein
MSEKIIKQIKRLISLAFKQRDEMGDCGQDFFRGYINGLSKAVNIIRADDNKNEEFKVELASDVKQLIALNYDIRISENTAHDINVLDDDTLIKVHYEYTRGTTIIDFVIVDESLVDKAL